MTSAKTTTEVLREARKLIADPARWCQKTLATDATTFGVDPRSPDATRWCAVGALCKVAGALYTYDPKQSAFNRARLLLDRAAQKAAGCNLGITGFNDTESHAEVVTLFDAAIEEAERKKW